MFEVVRRGRVLWAFVLFGSIVSAAAADTAPSNPVQPISELASPAAWQVRQGDEKYLIVSDADHCVGIGIPLPQQQEARLLLRQPIQIPAGNDLSFALAAKEFGRPLWINLIVQDAHGREYLFYTQSNGSLNPTSPSKGIFLSGKFMDSSLIGVSECRFTAPGLEHMDTPTPTFEPVNAGDPRPQAPLTLEGLSFKRDNEGAAVDDDHLYLWDFAWTDLNSRNSRLHYQFDDQECFGELDGLPHLVLGDMGRRSGQSFDISWDIRDRYAGQPFLTGKKSFQLDPSEKLIPYALQRCQQIVFPIREEGTYWVRVKLRWADQGSVPQAIKEQDYRLFVIKGKPAVVRKPLAESSPIGDSMIRIAPAREFLVWTAQEPLIVPVVFLQPPEAEPDVDYQIRAMSTTGQVIAQSHGHLDWSGNQSITVPMDLSTFPPSAYQIEATVLSGGNAIDQTVRLVGKQPAEPPAADAAASIPASAPSYQEIINGDKPLFQLSPMLDDASADAQHTQVDYLRGFMDQAAATTHELEYQVPWSKVEPLPGVYDFAELDQVLDAAREKDFAVQLWAVFHEYPEWLPSLYTQNDQGEIFGNPLYLFHGARPNLVQAAPLRNAAIRFLRNLVIHCRSHPAVQGYYFLLEWPGDAPFAGWYEGYDPYTLANFRSECRALYPSIEALNLAWQTNFTSFGAVQAPRRSQPATDRYWLDWLKFRSSAIHNFLLNCAKTIRSEDPKRLIMVYCDGLIPERLDEFRALGCMTANGGCADPERGSPDYIRAAADGVPQRAEEVTCGQWSAKTPTQLDASLFAMLMGGGGNSNCKMFIDMGVWLASHSHNLDVLRKPPYSLDRYEKLMPVWTELRSTVTLSGDIRYFEDFDSYLIDAKTNSMNGNNDGWATRDIYESHLLWGVIPGPDWQKAKLVLLIRHTDNLEDLHAKTIDELVQYVENGGTLVMRADAGRKCIEESGDDWALLRRFGFEPPVGPRIDDQYTKAMPVPNTLFAAQAQPFILRELWNAGNNQPGRAVALFDSDPNRVAVSEKAMGQGRVVVLWASTLVPPSEGGSGGYPLLRDIAIRAGAYTPVDASTPRFWLNLLANKSGSTYYGLVYCSPTPQNQDTQNGTVRYSLPDGNYQVRELISGTDLGQRTAAQLRDSGLEVTLAPTAVEVYRIQHLP
jgi:Beta-galactosidase